MGGSRKVIYEEPHFRFEDLGDRVEMYVCGVKVSEKPNPFGHFNEPLVKMLFPEEIKRYSKVDCARFLTRPAALPQPPQRKAQSKSGEPLYEEVLRKIRA
jgi:hypothetical protein